MHKKIFQLLLFYLRRFIFEKHVLSHIFHQCQPVPGANSCLSFLLSVSRSHTHLVYAKMCENISNIAFSAYLFVSRAIFNYQLCAHVQITCRERYWNVIQVTILFSDIIQMSDHARMIQNGDQLSLCLMTMEEYLTTGSSHPPQGKRKLYMNFISVCPSICVTYYVMHGDGM